MMDKTENKNKDQETKKQSAGQVLPEDKKHLKDDMPDHLKSPLHELKDKSDVDKKS